MAAPRMNAKKNKTVKPKKPNVGRVKPPAETRDSISRKKVGTSRPAKGVTPETARQRALTGLKQPGRSLTVTNKPLVKTGKQVAKNARTALTRTAKNAVGFVEKWIPNAIKPKGGGMGLVKVGGGIATAATSIVDPSFMNFKTEAQTEAAKQASKPSGPLMKGNKKYATKIGPQRPTARKPAPSSNYTGQGKTSVSPMTGAGRPEYPSSNTSKKASSASLRAAGAGTYTASYDVKTKKSGTSKAAKIHGGTAAQAAGKTSRRPQTKYQREALYMETRKR